MQRGCLSYSYHTLHTPVSSAGGSKKPCSFSLWVHFFIFCSSLLFYFLLHTLWLANPLFSPQFSLQPSIVFLWFSDSHWNPKYEGCDKEQLGSSCTQLKKTLAVFKGFNCNLSRIPRANHFHSNYLLHLHPLLHSSSQILPPRVTYICVCCWVTCNKVLGVLSLPVWNGYTWERSSDWELMLLSEIYVGCFSQTHTSHALRFRWGTAPVEMGFPAVDKPKFNHSLLTANLFWLSHQMSSYVLLFCLFLI